jgi:hypothetical protein
MCSDTPRRRGFELILLLALGACCLFSALSNAQQMPSSDPPAKADPAVTSPDAPSSAAIVSSSGPATPAPHAFWDRENVALFSTIAVLRGLDYASTRNFQARGRKEILLPQDVVNNSAGFASLEAAATVTSVGIAYLFHRTEHHKLERWVSITHASVTAFGDARNYALKTRRR